MQKISANHPRLTKAIQYAPAIWAVLCAILGATSDPLFFGAAFVYLVWFMWAPQDALCTMGPVYWITRKDTRNLSAGIGTMHQTTEPWRKGKGVYIVCAKHSFQIGLCKKQDLDEVDGILSAVKGRYLDVSPTEIGEWNAIQKGTQEPTPTA